MSIARLTNHAVAYSRAMDAVAAQTSDTELVKDPARLAMFQQQMYYAQTGYTLTARTIQDLHREDQILSEMLRDA